MANENAGNLPTVEAQQPPIQTQVPAENVSKELAREFRWVEFAQIISNVGLLIVGIAAVCIYAGQLTEMRRTTKAAQGSADAAKQAATVAQNQLELAERPWIKITDVKTVGNNPLIPAFSFQGLGHGPFPNGNKQATFQLKISMKNVGHSLAFVSADFELFFPAWKDNFEDIILTEETKFCNASAEKPPNKYLSRIVFPEEPLEWAGAGVQGLGPLMLPPNTINHTEGDPSGEYVLPVIIVCTNYSFPASQKRYQTKAMYIVVHNETGNRFFKVGGDVPERELRMIRDEMADNAY